MIIIEKRKSKVFNLKSPKNKFFKCRKKMSKYIKKSIKNQASPQQIVII